VIVRVIAWPEPATQKPLCEPGLVSGHGFSHAEDAAKKCAGASAPGSEQWPSDPEVKDALYHGMASAMPQKPRDIIAGFSP
jgi:hypothetical protein